MIYKKNNLRERGGGIQRHRLNRLWAVLVSVIMVLSYMPVISVWAETVSSGSCGEESSNSAVWTLDDSGLLTISGAGTAYYGGWDKESVITAVIEEGITGLEATFEECTNLTAVTFPDSLTYIGSWTFNGCSSLGEMTIPSAVTDIGSCAFNGCVGFSEINVEEGNTSYCSADGVLFNSDKSILHTYPAGKAAGDYDVPDTVGTIYNSAFYKSNVGNVTLPEGLVCIEHDAFAESTIASVNIPSTVTSAGENNLLVNILPNCTSLESVTVAEGNELFCSVDGVGFNADMTQLLLYPAAKSDNTEYSIPESVTSVGTMAFANNSFIQTVVIPDSVTEIGSSAFENCLGLASVNIPSGITVLEAAVFCNCASLVSIELPDTIETIRENAFNGTSLKSITIPDSVTSLESCIFENCSVLETAYISDSLTEIPERTFNYCYALTEVTLPSGLTSVGNNGFGSCSSLTAVNYSGSNFYSISFGWDNDYLISAYESSYEAEITWSIDDEGVLTVSGTGVMPSYEDSDGYRAPWNDYYESITAIVIEEGLTAIGDLAFDGLSCAETVSIPDTTAKIKIGAFRGCSNLSSITLPSALTSIGNNAFEDCDSITEITIPANVSSIGSSVFMGSNSLDCISVSDENTSFRTDNNILYSYDMTSLICCPGANSAISDFVIPSTVTDIWGTAFWECQTLKSVVIPESVTYISGSAFYRCYYLRDVTIPTTMTDIYGSAFSECPSLLNVYYSGTDEQWNSINIEDGNDALKNAYEYTTGYKENGATDLSYTLVDGVLTVSGNGWMPDYAPSWGWEPEDEYRPEWYAGRDEITSVVIEDGITRIGNFAFHYLTNVTSVTIADSVTEIGYQSFQFCSSLESITLSSNLTYVQAYAFDGCENLSTVNCSSEVWNNIEFEEDGNGNDNIINAYSKTNLKWNVSDGVLTIYTDLSEGIAIPNYTGDNHAPWYDYYDGEEKEVKTIVVDSSITAIGDYAFTNSQSVESVDIQGDITSIGKMAFQGCHISSLNLPASLTSIGSYAFQSCIYLASIELPENLTDLGDGAFDDCKSLAAITVADGNTSFCSDDNGVIYTADMTEIVACGAANPNVVNLVIPNTVKYVRGSFNGNPYIQTITIAEGASEVVIGGWNFSNLENLVSINLTGVTQLEGGTFYNCSSLKNITLPSSLTTMYDDEFGECTAIEKVYCVSGSTADNLSYYSASSNVNLVYADSKAVRASDDTVYLISGFSLADGDSLENYTKAELYYGDDTTAIDSSDTVYTGFVINGVEFEAGEMGYTYIIGYETTDNDDSYTSADEIADFVYYELKPVSDEDTNSEAE